MTLSNGAKPPTGARMARSPNAVLTFGLFFVTWVMMIFLYREQPSLSTDLATKLTEQMSKLTAAAASASKASTPKTAPVAAPVTAPVAPQPGSLAARRAQVNLKEIWMDDIEVDVILRYLGNVRKYLEWGSGGSTLNFAKFASLRAVSIEHSPTWCAMMPKRVQKAGIRPVEFHCVENSTSFAAEGNYRQFKAYVDEIANLNEPVWDFVLVDGRCRVGAAIKALSYISDNSVVVLHDSERITRDGALYRPILDYYDVVESLGGLRRRGISILRRKKKLRNLQGDHGRVQQILNDVFSKARYRR